MPMHWNPALIFPIAYRKGIENNVSEYDQKFPDGKYHDCLIKNGNLKIDYGWRSNIIVTRCRELLAAFMKGEAAAGIQYIALGRGDAAWDTDGVPATVADTEQLVDTAPFSIAITDAAMEIDFLDSVGEINPAVSHRIQATVTLDPGVVPIAVGESSFPLREFALFGRLDATDYMIDYVRHPVMHIGPADSLTRRVRLVF